MSLVRMAVLHYQFESIHPFYDGNGRTGRILNVLYLVKEDLLEIPVLYLSSHIVQTKAERRENDAVQGCHWTISLLKRWLLGTHAGAVRDKHLQAYLDEFAFRHNRRKTKGVGRIAARVLEQLVIRPPRTMRMLVDETRRCRWFGTVKPTAN